MSDLEIYRNKLVLVTGNMGFKGSWLSLWLAKLGARVLGYSLGPPSTPNMFDVLDLMHHPDITTEAYGDVRNRTELSMMVKIFKPEIIFHLAAQPIMRRSIRDPVFTLETNIMGTMNILEEVLKNSDFIKAAVLITSDKCYENNPKPNGYSEEDKLGGDDPYSASKASAEHVISAYRNSYGLNVASTRAGNIIGGGDWGEDRLLPDCIRHLSSGQEIVIRNPSHLRPWQFVLDPLYGYLLLGSKLLTKGKKYAQAWNFGPPEENYINVEQLVQKTIAYWGSGKYSIVPQTTISESKLLRLNCSKSNEILGWKPKYKIDEALKETISWYKWYYGGEDMLKFTEFQIEKYMGLI